MRTMMPRSIAALAGAVALSGALAGGTIAQDSRMLECPHEPRVLDELMTMFGEVAPAGAGESASLDRNDAALEAGERPAIPLGTSADEATAQAAEEPVHGLVACFNAGDLLGGWGGVTDEFLTSQVDTSIFDEDFVDQIEAGPVALPEDQHTTIVAFGDHQVHEDGRVGVLVQFVGPAQPGEGIAGVETDLFILEEVDGRWLLDEVIENLEAHVAPAVPSDG